MIPARALWRSIGQRWRKKKSPTIKTPIRLQGNPVDCGAACLGILLEYYGHTHSTQELRQLCAVGRDGATVAQIQRGVQTLGHQCKIVKKGIESLRCNSKPIIIHWDLRHFVVLEGIYGDCVSVNDPAFGRRRMTLEAFDRHFTGVCLEVRVEEWKEKDASPASWGVLLALAPEGDGLFRRAALVGTCVGGILICIEMLFGGLLRLFFDYVVELQMARWGYVAALAGLPLLVARFLLLHFQLARQESLISDLLIRMKRSFLEQFYQYPTDFFEAHFAGELFGRMQDMDDCLHFSLRALNALGMQIITVSVVTVVLTAMAPAIAVVHLGPQLLLVIWLFFISTRSREQELQARADTARYQALQIQRGTGHLRFFASGLQHHLLVTCLPMLGRRQAAQASHQQRVLGFAAARHSLQLLSQPLSAFTGAYLMIDGQLTFGGFTFAALLAAMLSKQLDQIVETIREYCALQPVVRRAAELLENTAAGERSENSELSAEFLPLSSPPQVLIEVRDLGFGYNGVETLLFDHLNFSVKKGAVVNIAGPSGAGKTTLLDLLAGLRHPLKGVVYFNGQRLTKPALAGFVFADDEFVTGSLADFVANGEPVNLKRLTDVLHVAELWDRLGFFANSDGDEHLENQGLSRGEVQRLLLAQALYRSQECLFFDEAFNHLALEQSERILQRLRAQGTTVVMATHRPEVQALCDQNILLA